MSERKLYKTILHIEVLSEDMPVEDLSLAAIAEACDTGDCVGRTSHTEVLGLNECAMARELELFGSEPGFFQLDDIEQEASRSGPGPVVEQEPTEPEWDKDAGEPMSDDQYLAVGGGKCPSCGSDQIEGDSANFDSNCCWQTVRCLSCDAEWNDIYDLTGYNELRT